MSSAHFFFRLGMLLGLLSLAAACNAADKLRTPMTSNDPLIIHRIGRFMVQIPESMKVVRRSATLRGRELEEVVITDTQNRIAAYEAIWKQRVDELQKRPPPTGKERVVIDTKTLDQSNVWTRAVAYYGNTDIPKMAYWDIFSASGNHGLWVKWKGKESRLEYMLNVSLDVARAYHPFDSSAPSPRPHAFHLEHGYIALPYLEQEEAYARFEGHPLGLKLRVETKVVHEDEPQDEGLLGRLAAVLSTGFASGVDIKKIRTGKREIGGLKGEETVLRAKSEQETDLSFLWRYAGKKDLGDHPEIVIEIETADGQLDEKLKLWDAVLNSFKPVAQ